MSFSDLAGEYVCLKRNGDGLWPESYLKFRNDSFHNLFRVNIASPLDLTDQRGAEDNTVGVTGQIGDTFSQCEHVMLHVTPARRLQINLDGFRIVIRLRNLSILRRIHRQELGGYFIADLRMWIGRH